MKRIIFAIILIIGVAVTIHSCKKDRINSVNSEVNLDAKSIDQINNYRPSDEKIGDAYRAYANYYTNVSTLKSGSIDQRIDTAMWNVETYFNNQYGFRDSATYYKSHDIIDTVVFSVNNYDNGIPIIDGDEFDSFIASKASDLSQENSNSDSLYFWCSRIELDKVSNNNAYVILTVTIFWGPNGVYPPGWNPNNFPHYTCMQANWTSICDGKRWYGAAKEFESRYEVGGVATNPNYILVPFNSFYKTKGSYGVEDGELWEHPWDPTEILDTNPPEDRLNYYLQSTKNMIDRFNPNGINGIVLGNLSIYNFENLIQYPYYNTHLVEFYTFERVYVEPPQD